MTFFFFDQRGSSTATLIKKCMGHKETMLKNKPYLVTFHNSIFFSLWTFQSNLVDHITVKLFKQRKVPPLVGSILVAGVLTHCALLNFVCDLKVAQMNVHCSLIQELKLYKFELSHNAMGAHLKDKGAVYHSTVTR